MTKRPTDAPMPDDDALLAPFFASARAPSESDLPDALHARLLQDALAQMPAPPPVTAPARGVRPVAAGLMARVGNGVAAFGRQSARLLGGAPGVAVVCTAGLAGIWIGLAAPGSTADLLGYIAPGSSVVDDDSVWSQAALDLGEDEALLALLDSF